MRWHGKPHRSVYESCFGLMGIGDKTRILAIGDSLRTDIAGANGAGIDSLLIAGGLHASEFAPSGELDLACVGDTARVAGVRPDAVTYRFNW